MSGKLTCTLALGCGVAVLACEFAWLLNEDWLAICVSGADPPLLSCYLPPVSFTAEIPLTHLGEANRESTGFLEARFQFQSCC